MKTVFRTLFGYMTILPFVAALIVLSLLLGRQKALGLVGPIATRLAQRALKYWVPEIASSKDFDSFPAKMKKNFRIWAPLYDIEISEESKDLLKLKVSNCPFCEALNRLGYTKLSAYVCQGDWAIAQDNVDKWKFQRNHQIGTGDRFCDHTYKRIIK